MKRRSEELKFRKPVLLEPARMAVTVEDLRSNYDSLAETIEEYRIHPALLANVDQTMLKSIRKWRKVVSRAEDPDPFVSQDDKVMHITLLPTVFANGDSLPALIILPLKHIPDDLPDELLVSFHWAGQTSGWISRVTFHRFMTQVFFPAIRERRKQFDLTDRWALLLLDGHSSRENPQMLEECLAEKILVKTYVSHASHMSQVLDRGIFREFKTDLTSRKSTVSFANRCEWRKQMLLHAAKSMRVATEKSIVISAWKESGCWPVDSSKAINKKNFPDLDLPAEEPPLATKRKRSGFKVSNQILTSREVIDALLLRDSQISSSKISKRA